LQREAKRREKAAEAEKKAAEAAKRKEKAEAAKAGFGSTTGLHKAQNVFKVCLGVHCWNCCCTKLHSTVHAEFAQSLCSK
jgi:hypothetical protein